MSAIACPGCAAPLPTRNPGIVTAVCAYCGNVVHWDEDAVRDAGFASHLSEGFTRLYTGATGELLGRPMEVLGRVRHGWSRGFWDEWWVRVGDGGAWITEDDHELALEGPRARESVGPHEAYRAGATRNWNGVLWVVEEVGEAEVLALEGQLPAPWTVGTRYRFVDLATRDGRAVAGFEYDDPAAPDHPSVYRGRWLDHEALVLGDEGLAW